MSPIQTFGELQTLLQAGLDDNEETLSRFGATYVTQLKAYLLESNRDVKEFDCPLGNWKKIDSDHWYTNIDSTAPGTLFLDTTRKRVWILYTILEAGEADNLINKWVSNSSGLDRCWLSRNQLLHYDSKESWHEKGIGLSFSDGLTPEENASNFSLKAWYGTTQKLPGLAEILKIAKDEFAIYSTRWQKIQGGNVTISAEWYSNGKVTINRGHDIEEIMFSVSDVANRYEDSLIQATNLRDDKMGAFELNFSQEIDLSSFAQTVSKGKGDMNLWLVETESSPDFKRFRGLDLHTWDRIFMDVGPDYAYLTVPGNGCVNAAPRIATVQGEDNAGKTSIYFDGVEVFA